MDDLTHRVINSCLVIMIVIGLFISLLFIIGAIVLILGPHYGGF